MCSRPTGFSPVPETLQAAFLLQALEHPFLLISMLPLPAPFRPWHKHHFLKEVSRCHQSRSGLFLCALTGPHSFLSENLVCNYVFIRVIVWLTNYKFKRSGTVFMSASVTTLFRASSWVPGLQVKLKDYREKKRESERMRIWVCDFLKDLSEQKHFFF